MAEHALKCWPSYFGDVVSGVKTFDLRENDRPYAVGDHLLLQEWVHQLGDAKGFYTGNEARFEITGIMRGRQKGSSPLPRPECAIDPDYVILSIKAVTV